MKGEAAMFEMVSNTFPKGWAEIVTKWGEMNDEYYRKENDLPAWYVENANTALFSVAAWNCGFPAICEVDCAKQPASNLSGNNGEDSNGRVDLEMTVNKQRFWLEAKRRHFEISQSGKYSLRHAYLLRSVKHSIKDAEKCREAAKSNGAQLGALVFFSGSFSRDSSHRQCSQDERSKLIKDEIEKAKTKLDNFTSDTTINVNYAFFSRSDFRIEPSYRGLNWPVVYGVCGVHDIPKRASDRF